jgi:hypothetical protein
MVRALIYGAAAVAFVLAGQSHAFASNIAPEIDGSSLAAGFGVLGAGILMLRARRAGK